MSDVSGLPPTKTGQKDQTYLRDNPSEGVPAKPEYFEGWQPRNCGEHRTVGPHRAWCYDCAEWCYPGKDMGCNGCMGWEIRAEQAENELVTLRARLAAVEAERDQLIIERDEDSATGNAGMTLSEWDEWSNDLANLLPERYDDDIAQEAVIMNAVGDMAERLCAAEGVLVHVRAECEGRAQYGLASASDYDIARRHMAMSLLALLGDKPGAPKTKESTE